MKRKLRIISLMLCLLVCMVSLISCVEKGGDDLKTSEQESESGQTPTTDPGQEPPDQPTPTEEKTYLFTDSIDQIKLLGRSYLTDGAATCDFTASGFEMNVNAVGKLMMTVDASAQTYFSVFVDGVRKTKRISVPEGENVEVELISFAEPGEHHIRVLKQTEAEHSLCLLKSLTFQGTLLEKPADRELLIEYIGDSIFCGLGNYRCPNGTPDAGSAKYQDGTIAYPLLTADALNADCSVIGFSGMGVKVGSVDYNAADVYEKQSYLRDPDAAYGFARTSDLVVINLGTNDALFRDRTTKEEFKTAVKDLITMVRELNGRNMPIVWAYNALNDGCLDWIREAIGEMGGESNWLFLCGLTRNADGGNNHPSENGHQTSCEKLTAFIREKGLLELTGEIPPRPSEGDDLPILWV